jgi:hypothetical protein
MVFHAEVETLEGIAAKERRERKRIGLDGGERKGKCRHGGGVAPGEIHAYS